MTVQETREALWAPVRDAYRRRFAERPAGLLLSRGMWRIGKLVTGVNWPLTPRAELLSGGEELSDPELAALLSDDELGLWAMAAVNLDWMLARVEELKPRTVIEFGAGASTLCLSVVLRRLHGAGGYRVLSVEQDADYAAGVAARVAAIGASEDTRVVHAPLVPMRIARTKTRCYDVPNAIREHLDWLGAAEFAVVDGPSVKGLSRYGTLASVRPWLAPGAHFLLDDGLRDRELRVARLWQRDGFRVDGVLAIGKGVITGTAP